jgi:ribosomal protein S18 acetylase RimI-like enzyme
MGRLGGGVERSDDLVHWTVGGSPIGYHNAVVRCSSASVVPEFAAALGGLPGSWHLTPSSPHDLPAALVDAGFADGGVEPAMACPLQGDLVAESALRFGHDLAAYREVLAAGFGEGPKEADWVASVFERGGPEWHHYVGYDGGVPVSTATLFIEDGVAGIYFVATTPGARGRGFGTEITSHVMVEARRLGASLAVLGSSPMGQRIYERLGFRTVFELRLFESG